MSFEAIGNVRKLGALGEFGERWLTVPTADVDAAIRAFQALGFETRGVRILTQEAATELARAEFGE